MRLIDADSYAYPGDLTNEPTVDAVPVVRCKDCKHFDGNNACYSHAADENGTPIFVREHDFCSYGERREHERNE